MAFFRCYQAILETILPILPKDAKYHDQNVVQISFEKMLPGVMSLVADALASGPNPEWIKICKYQTSLLITHNTNVSSFL